MIPKAILLFYEPGHRFRYKKYYLKAGDNFIGSDPSCQLYINSIVNPLQSKTANIHVGENLMLLINLSNEVQVYGNMNNKKKLVPLEANSKYYIQMEKDFFIGPYKTIVQVLDLNQLLQIRNIENQEKFAKEAKNDFVEFSQELTDKKQNQSHNVKPKQQVDEARSDKTQEIKQNDNFEPTLQMSDDNGNFQPTIQLNDNDNQLPTLKMDDQYGGFQPTIAIDNQKGLENPIKVDKQNIQTDKKILQFKIPQIQSSQKTEKIQKGEFSQHTQKIQNGSVPNNQEEDDISMPDTLRQDQMPQTIKENQQIGVSLPKIQRMARTAPQTAKQQKQQLIKKNKSWQLKKQPQKIIQDFDDLFQVKENEVQKKGKILFSSLQINDDKTQNLGNSKKYSMVERKKSQENSQNSKINTSRLSSGTKKKYAVSGFKLTQLQKNQMKKRGFQPIADPNQEYDILIVGKDLKRTSRLLIALMKGKEIYSDLWIANPAMKIVGKIQGFPWESIQKRKGNAGNIFKGKYYLTQSLQVQFKQVMQVGGADFVESLKKIRHNQQLLLIINVKQKQDQQLYMEKKHYKKWHFYSHLMIIESALIGEEVREKYKIDQSSF